MSWPDDGQPRYVVVSVSGIAIKAGYGAGTYKPKVIPVCSQVLDRAYCHRVVREFRPEWEVGAGRTDKARGRADALAASLNLADTASDVAA